MKPPARWTGPDDKAPTPPTLGSGMPYALGAYGVWAVIFPVYLVMVGRLVGDTAGKLAWSAELLAHRVVWSVLLCAALVAWRGQIKELLAVLRSRRALAALAVTAVLIGVNWICFIYGAASGRLSEASLGYYINPLISVGLGVVFLGERLRPMQVVAIVCAAVGVGYQTVVTGGLPWISLTVACSFALYGLMRKRGKASPLVGLTIETGLVTPLALGYLGWLAFAGGRDGAPPLLFTNGNATLTTLFVLAGPITALPLMWFASAARRLRLSTIGLMQYLSPTGQFIIAATMNNEPFTVDKLVVFACIWLGVAVFAADSLRASRREKADGIAARAAAAAVVAVVADPAHPDLRRASGQSSMVSSSSGA